MTKDQITTWAREAELDAQGNLLPLSQVFERFAALVAAAAKAEENEACAKLVDDHERHRCEAWIKVLATGGEVPSASLFAVAAAIRARGRA